MYNNKQQQYSQSFIQKQHPTQISYDNILSSLDFKIGNNGLLQINRNQQAEIQKSKHNSHLSSSSSSPQQQLPQQYSSQQQQHYKPNTPTIKHNNSLPTFTTIQPHQQQQQPHQQLQQQQQQPHQQQQEKINYEVIQELSDEEKELNLKINQEKIEELKRQQALNYFQKINNKKSKKLVFS
jgi:hypothetical protein